MENQEITKERFLSATVTDISSVYNGKQNCCRCGCGGTYTSTSAATHSRNIIDDRLVVKRLRRCQKLVANGAEVKCDTMYVDVTVGKDRTMTFYFIAESRIEPQLIKRLGPLTDREKIVMQMTIKLMVSK